MLTVTEYAKREGVTDRTIRRWNETGKIKVIKKGKVRYVVDKNDRQQRKTDQKQTPKVMPHPTAGRKVLEFEDHLDKQLAGEALDPKPGPERPAEPPQFELDVIKPVVALPFEFWAKEQNIEKLKLSESELMLLSKPIRELLNYYLPQIPIIAYAWISLSVGAFSVMKVRLELIAELKKQKPAAGGQPSSSPAPTVTKVQFPTETKTEKV